VFPTNSWPGNLSEFCAALFSGPENCRNFAPDKFLFQKIVGFSAQPAEKE
jgi:hypothetical protein